MLQADRRNLPFALSGSIVEPRNLLVIHLGQLGDVVLGIPALDALRTAYPDSRITALTGTPADQLVRLAGLADEVVGVDRVALRDGPKLKSIGEILRLARRMRSRRFDAVVDIHAFYESGLLALVTGARMRVGPRRENRSLPGAYTSTAPYDLDLHVSDRYLAVSAAAGAPARVREPRLIPAPSDLATVDARLESAGASGAVLVGLNPGAGWENRRWPADRFIELGRRLIEDGCRIAVFAGPEEAGLGERLAEAIGVGAQAMEGLSLGQLAAALSRCHVVVSNDTGPSHISAAVGTPTVVLMPGNAGPSPFAVRGDRHTLIHGETVLAIPLDDVDAATRRILGRPEHPVEP